MDIRLNPEFLKQVTNSPETAQLLVRAGGPLAARIAANTPVDSGETRSSTRVEGGHRSASGRTAAARVVQSGAAVQQQFGNAREHTPARQFDRGA